MIYNTKREEELIAETNFRDYCAIACLHGKEVLFLLLNNSNEYSFTACDIFFILQTSFTSWVEPATLTMTTAFPTKS